MENQKSITKSDKKIALKYMETLVDVARESFLILDAHFKVVSGNPLFYKTFKVSSKQTKGRSLYKLGDGQWDIPELQKLLGEVLPKKKTIKDFEVKHVFEKIGEKTIMLNARQIDEVQLIILAFEDITDRKKLEEKLIHYTKELETEVGRRTEELAEKIQELETVNKSMVGRELKMVELKKEMQKLKKRVENGNGKNRNGKNGNHKNGRKK